jgi:hypothetical protein
MNATLFHELGTTVSRVSNCVLTELGKEVVAKISAA